MPQDKPSILPVGGSAWAQLKVDLIKPRISQRKSTKYKKAKQRERERERVAAPQAEIIRETENK